MLRRVTVAVVILAALTVGVFLFFRPTQTVTNDADYQAATSATSLYCHNDGLLDIPLFDEFDALSRQHEVEALFYGDQLHDITYTYTGQYADHDATTVAEAHIHAAMDTKLANLNLSDVTPSYSVLDAELITRITLTDHTLRADAAPMVLLASTTEPISALPQGIAAVKNIYTSQGFVCQQQNNK